MQEIIASLLSDVQPQNTNASSGNRSINLAETSALLRKGAMPMQVVLGVLGCPNLPQQPIQEEDGAAGVAERVGTEGIGCLFTAIKGQGAFVGALNGNRANNQGHIDVTRSMLKLPICIGHAVALPPSCVQWYGTCQSSQKATGELCGMHAILLPVFLCSMVCNPSNLTQGKEGERRLILAEPTACVKSDLGKPLRYYHGLAVSKCSTAQMACY